MTPEGRLCVRTFNWKGMMNLHMHFQNDSEFVTQDQELEDEKMQIPFWFQAPLFHKNEV